jgi:hypothetical protein
MFCQQVKPGNVFFHTSGTEECNKVCLIDYQWSGVALGVTDIIYLLATSASDSFIQDVDLDEQVLRPYYTAFIAAYQTHWATHNHTSAR